MRAEQSGYYLESSHISPVDPYIDRALSFIGVDPKSVETFLSKHPLGSRIAVNTISLARIGLAKYSLDVYERAHEHGDRLRMIGGLAGGAVALGSDCVDGYLARKAHIDGSRSGKVIDSLSDALIRNMFRESPLFFQGDMVDKARLIGEAGVMIPSLADIMNGRFQSTATGQIKQATDGAMIFVKALAGLLPDSLNAEERVEPLTDFTRLFAAGLAVKDGIDRSRTIINRVRRR